MDINEVLLKYERMMVVIINQIGVSNYDLREDLIQELRIHLVKIYNSGLLNGDIKNISDYIFIILKRKAIDLIIKENKYNNKSLNWMHFNSNKEKLIDQFANENSGIDKQNIIEDIISYISVHLSEDEQLFINLYFFKNNTLEEISKIHNVSGETIRRKIKSAITKIRRWYI